MERQKLNFSSATLIGIGAIVGGGVFVLGGVTIVEAGSAALLAFLFNGLLALLTARSYAELSRLFPESGGTYTYAKRMLSVRAAFIVGWMLWLAHIVAALLYALGFSAYFSSVLARFAEQMFGLHLEFLGSKLGLIVIGGGACCFYTLLALRKLASGGVAANLVKLVLFAGLIGVGLYLVVDRGYESATSGLVPFFPSGYGGLVAAMGYSFIALQGFELIAASSGEIKEPHRIVPRAMYTALAIALFVYLPLILIVLTVGVPEGMYAQEWCATRKETCIADAAYNFLGATGYWVVSITAIAATLSALQANLIASSAMARTMALDRTLPRIFASLHERYGTPEVAVVANLGIVLVLLIALPDASAAGSAASLTFLICFAFTHVLALIARVRCVDATASLHKRVWQNLIPACGGIACIALAVFQLCVERSGGAVLLGWICIGGLTYYVFLSTRAEALDAYSAASDPSIPLYRGQVPVVIVPISNPERVEALSSIAKVIAPKGIGRVLLLSVAVPGASSPEGLASIEQASKVVSKALLNAASGGRERLEGIVALNRDPWRGIKEVAATYKCETLLLGFSGEDAYFPDARIGNVLAFLHMNIVILSAPPGWNLSQIKKVLVPVGGKGGHDRFRARILGGLTTVSEVDEIIFLRILPTTTAASSVSRVKRTLEQRVADEAPRVGKALVDLSDCVDERVLQIADAETLIILGLSGQGTDRSSLGKVATAVATRHAGGVMIIRHGR